jgi:hypothetical protein
MEEAVASARKGDFLERKLRKYAWVLIFGLLALSLAWPSGGRDEGLKRWTDRLVPLPHNIDVAGSVRLTVQDVSVSIRDSGNPLLRTAAEILKPYARGGGFDIRGVLAGADCPADLRESLKGCPNGDQAYAIRPLLEGSRFGGLFLAANTPLGLLYAARTLGGMIGAPGSDGRIEIPRLTLLDWPDLAERGEWGGNAILDLAWLAERKMNTIDVHAQLGFAADGSPRATLDGALLAEAARLGIRIVPIILHMEQLANTGLFKFHPEIAAVPEPGRPLPTDYTPPVCFSRPETADLLAGWMGQLLDLPGGGEVNVWLSETENRCYCPLCAGQEPFVLETKGIVRAFEKARVGRPNASLRILLTQASHDVNDQVLAAAAPETKVIYYDGGRTYDSSHKPMIDPLLENFARSGRWLGVYPQLTNSWRTVFPFSGPQFMRARMNEFADKGLRNFIGYATPNNRYYEFNVTAAAEWGWNSRGRTPREFAEAYAVSRHLSSPADFAEWAETLGVVGWKLAGSRSVEKLVFGAGGLGFIEGRIVPGGLLESLRKMDYGKEFLSEFDSRGDFEDSRARVRKAMSLARKIGDAAVLYETQSVEGILDLLAGLRNVMGAMPPAGGGGTDKRMGPALNGLDDAARSLTTSIEKWGMAVNPLPRKLLASRFRDSVDFAAHTAEALRAAAGDGLPPDPQSAYRSRIVARWTDKDFAASASSVLWADVTGELGGPGEYDVTLRFEDGASGVQTHAVTFLRGVDRDSAVPIDEDRAEFHLGRYDRYFDYWLKLPSDGRGGSPAADRFFLKIEISGPPLEAPPDRRTSRGVVSLRKSWRS